MAITIQITESQKRQTTAILKPLFAISQQRLDRS